MHFLYVVLWGLLVSWLQNRDRNKSKKLPEPKAWIVDSSGIITVS